MLSKGSKNIIRCYEMGYRVSKEGLIESPHGRILKGSFWRGYTCFSVRDGDNHMKIYAHRLQAYQKFGDKMFEPKILVRHLNDVGTDNRWDNIAIGTQSDNMMDMCPKKRKEKAIHASRKRKKYDNDKVKEFYAQCKSYSITMKEFGMTSKGTLSYILHKAL